MICPACGVESAPGQFCSNCGAELPAGDYEQTADDYGEQQQATQMTDEYEEQSPVVDDTSQQTYDTGEYEQQSHEPDAYDQTVDATGQYEESAYEDTGFDEQTYEEQPVDASDDLFGESEPETAATDDLFASDSNMESGATGGGAGAMADNEIVDKTKEAASNFGSFFLSHLKEPMTGIKSTKDQLISSIITLSIFSLLIALNSVIMYSKVVSSGAFVDGFLMPLIGSLVLFAVISGITFAGISITHQSGTFIDTVSKVGSLAVPFLSLYVLAFLISFMGLPRIFLIFALTSILGVAIVIPAIIILEKASKRFDQVFVLLGITLINLIVVGYIMSSLIESMFLGMLGGMMGGIMGGF